MSKSTSTEREEFDQKLDMLIEAEETLTNRLTRIRNERKQVEFTLNRLRREAGEIP